MNRAFRQSMSLLHTWAGLLLGTVLFAVFWMGSLSVFDREIDRWMMPDTRQALPASLSLDRSLLPAVTPLVENGAQQWGVTLPDARAPQYRLFYQDGKGEFHSRLVDAHSGELLPEAGTLAATRFIFPFHYRLNFSWMSIGYWLVGLAAMAMLVLLVSGVIVHRKLFREFFLFRPEKRFQRSSLDLHNLSGVLALPFHFVITLSGLIIFISIYFPDAPALAYAGEQSPQASFFAEGSGRYLRLPSGVAAPLQSLDELRQRAEVHWNDEAGFVRVRNAGDSQAVVEIGRSVKGEVSWNIDKLYFDGASGELLHEFSAAPMMAVQRFFVGLHFIQFERWSLRWLYFLAGLAGCVMIATGFFFWLEARRKRLVSSAGFRAVEALTVGSVSGIVLATFSYFVINRLLPSEFTVFGAGRAAVEVWVFYLTWLTSFVHAATRCYQRAFAEQCLAIAVTALLAVLLNALSTGDHLLATLSSRQWAIAGMDLMLLAAAAIAMAAARRLRGAAVKELQTTASLQELAE